MICEECNPKESIKEVYELSKLKSIKIHITFILSLDIKSNLSDAEMSDS